MIQEFDSLLFKLLGINKNKNHRNISVSHDVRVVAPKAVVFCFHCRVLHIK